MIKLKNINQKYNFILICNILCNIKLVNLDIGLFYHKVSATNTGTRLNKSVKSLNLSNLSKTFINLISMEKLDFVIKSKCL